MNTYAEILLRVRKQVGDKRYFGADGALEAFRQMGVLAQARVYLESQGQPTEEAEAYIQAIQSEWPDITDFTEWRATAVSKFKQMVANNDFTDNTGEAYLKSCLETFGLEDLI